jgi:hypothetical protein
MANKNFWLGILVMVLAFGLFFVAGCKTEVDDNPFVGTWIGTRTVPTIPTSTYSYTIVFTDTTFEYECRVPGLLVLQLILRNSKEGFEQALRAGSDCRVIGSTVLLFAARRATPWCRRTHVVVRWPAVISLALEDHAAFAPASCGAAQPATSSLAPSDQCTNLSL